MTIRNVLAVRSMRRLPLPLLAAAAVFGSPVASAPSATAEPCPDVEVVFARGSGEPPGIGGIGRPFVDALRSEIGAKSLTV